MYSPVKETIPILNAGYMANRLPSSYNINNTIISKLLLILEEEINEFRTACYGVEDIHDFDKKYGENIDKFATNYDLFRRGDSDDKFKDRIKIKLSARGSLGDNDTILKVLGDYFNRGYSEFETKITDIRKMDVGIPGDLDVDEVYGLVKSVKAAGIRLEITPDKYWEDLVYEDPLSGSIADLTYEELENYRYERNNN